MYLREGKSRVIGYFTKTYPQRWQDIKHISVIEFKMWYVDLCYRVQWRDVPISGFCHADNSNI